MLKKIEKDITDCYSEIQAVLQVTSLNEQSENFVVVKNMHEKLSTNLMIISVSAIIIIIIFLVILFFLFLKKN
jgi:hypothetical protein